MPIHDLPARAAEPLGAVIRTLAPSDLGARTPCAEYDLRALVNHLLFWGPSLAGAAARQEVPPPAAAEEDLDLTAGNWTAALQASLDRTVAAWSEPDAWVGVTRMGGPMELPAPMIGGMVLGELVVHGWDLARATGQSPLWDVDLLRHLQQDVAGSAEMGREMGIYGPAVPVPDTASTLDRVLGLTGREPHWAP